MISCSITFSLIQIFDSSSDVPNRHNSRYINTTVSWAEFYFSLLESSCTLLLFLSMVCWNFFFFFFDILFSFTVLTGTGIVTVLSPHYIESYMHKQTNNIVDKRSCSYKSFLCLLLLFWIQFFKFLVCALSIFIAVLHFAHSLLKFINYRKRHNSCVFVSIFIYECFFFISLYLIFFFLCHSFCSRQN